MIIFGIGGYFGVPDPMVASIYVYDVTVTLNRYCYDVICHVNFELARFCHLLSDFTDFLLIRVTFCAESNGGISYYL